MFSQAAPNPARTRWISIAVLCALLLAFATVAWLAVRGKSATFDEPNDSIEGWIALRYGDYRISPADPPLVYYWAALPQPKTALKADFNSAAWHNATRDIASEHQFSVDTLYHTPGNDADAFIARSRAMMLALAILCGAIMAWWGWKMGGSIVAITATALFCFDPNFLAHSPLVKNDVSIALAAVA